MVQLMLQPMVLWRISNHPDLTGAGAERSSGRWHTAAPGRRIVYLAEHPAVALLENLANLGGDPSFFPDHFQLARIGVPADLQAAELRSEELSRVERDNPAPTQAIGDEWLAGGKGALLRVPSVPSPESSNYLLNPLHPEAAGLRVEWVKRIAYDKRLFHLEG
jgi:RES domain-containing protein